MPPSRRPREPWLSHALRSDCRQEFKRDPGTPDDRLVGRAGRQVLDGIAVSASIPFGGHPGHNFHSLAAVQQDPWSLTLVLPALSLLAIQLIEAHLALGASVPITSLAGLLAKSGDPKQQRSHVVAVVETLATCGVAWSDDGVISHLASGFDKLVPSPLGLGPSMESNLTRMNVEDIKRTLRHLGLPRTGDRTTLEAKLRAFRSPVDFAARRTGQSRQQP